MAAASMKPEGCSISTPRPRASFYEAPPAAACTQAAHNSTDISVWRGLCSVALIRSLSGGIKLTSSGTLLPLIETQSPKPSGSDTLPGVPFRPLYSLSR
jgi:hypothetical protein